MRLRSLLLAVPMAMLALPSPAYIEALNSLKGVFTESDVIARAVVDAVSTEKRVIILKVTKPEKGKSVYEKIKIDLNAGPDWHPDVVLKHATVGSSVSVFYHKNKETDKADVSLIYLNRFFITAQPDDVMWRLGKIELAMTKVFTGTTEELNGLATKIQSGRSKAPEPKADFKPYTREILQALPPPPKEGDAWIDFDVSKHLKAP